MARTIFFLKCCFVLFVVALTGIALTSRPALAGPCDGPAEVSKITLLADWAPSLSQGPMETAMMKGYYKDEGLELKIIAPMNPADTVKLAARERVSFSMASMVDALTAREQGIPVVSIAAIMRSRESGLAVLAESDISSPADLKGKVLGVNPTPSIMALARGLLKAGGLTEEDVKIVDPGYGALTLLISGKIDAAHGGPPFAENFRFLEATKAAGLQPIKWIMYKDYGAPFMYFLNLVSSEAWAKSHPSTICRFLRATARGVDAFYEDPDPAIASIAKQNEIFTLEAHASMVAGSKSQFYVPDGSFWHQDAKTWADVQAWALEEGLISIESDPSEYFTNEYLPD